MNKYCIYKFLDKENNIIYIGKTKELDNRMTQHFNGYGHLPKECYEEVKNIMYFICNNSSDMDLLEKYYIDKFKPLYNKKDIDLNFSFDFEINHEAKWTEYKENIKNKNKKGQNVTRPVTKEEYQEIMNLIKNGFITKEGKTFRPNPQLALILQLQATLGLRVCDILELEINNFKNDSLEINEQIININFNIYNEINNYYKENQNYKINIGNKKDKSNKIFKVNIRTIQKQLNIVCEHLELKNISTYSFKKFHSNIIYNDIANKDNCTIKELLNVNVE